MKTSKIIFLLFLPFLFGYSFILVSSYTGGDQLVYRALYHELSETNFIDVVETSVKHVVAADWVSFYILWGGAFVGFDKDIFIACSNVLLLSFLIAFLRKYEVGYGLIILFIFNYYIVVLMTSAERLKFAIIFLLLSELINNKKIKIIMHALSIFSHMQMLIIYGAIFFGNFLSKSTFLLYKNRVPKREFIKLILIVMLLSIFVFLQYEGLTSKINSYIEESGGFVELGQISLIIIIGLLYLRNKLLYLSSMAPLIFMIYLIGGQRINMIAYMIFLYYFLVEKKQNNIFFGAIIFYFFFKSFPFVVNIFKYGNGYH